MAVDILILCNPLCFLLCKYKKYSIKVLKSTLIEFYDAADITKAKKQLVEDIKNANFAEKLPYIPERRSGERHTVNEIDDIFVLIDFMDERKLLSSLPVYVAGNPDNMPSMRLYEGDFKVLISLLEKLKDNVSSHGSAIAAIVNDLHNLQAKSTSSMYSANVLCPSTNQGVINSTVNTLPLHAVMNDRTGNPNQGNYLVDNDNHSTGVNKPSAKWADIVAASTPHHPHTRVDALSTATDDDDQSDNPFIEQHSRKFKRYAKRKMDSSLSPSKTDQQQHQSTTADSVKRRGHSRHAVYGCSSDGAGIAAANKLVKKAVYCIDNIDVSYNVEDIIHHVRRQGITVISCFEAKPRNRRSDNYTNQRKAFRLCINYDHRNKLLDSSRWPDSVVVSEWFFKSQQTSKMPHDTPVENRLRTDSPSHQSLSERDSVSLRSNSGLTVDSNAQAQPTGTNAEFHAVDDMDLTIVTQYANKPADHQDITPTGQTEPTE